MFDALGTNGTSPTTPLPEEAYKTVNGGDNGTSNPLHEVIQHLDAKLPLASTTGTGGNNYSKLPPPSSATIVPSSTIHKVATPAIRQTALNPTSKDTTKDTAKLVEEDSTD